MIDAKIIAFIGAALFGIVAVLTIFLALGFPLGEFTMGGKYKVIPPKMRVVVCCMLAVQIFAIIVILQTGQIMPLWFGVNVTRGICFFFAAYLSLNTIMNFISHSKKEKLLMTPLSALAASCFWITAYSAL